MLKGKAALVKSKAALGKALAKKECLVAAKDKTKKTAKLKAKTHTIKKKPKPIMTPEELKAFRVELMAMVQMLSNPSNLQKVSISDLIEH